MRYNYILMNNNADYFARKFAVGGVNGDALSANDVISMDYQMKTVCTCQRAISDAIKTGFTILSLKRVSVLFSIAGDDGREREIIVSAIKSRPSACIIQFVSL